jgi:tagatose-6-phosphate ketose/aldose isomerase
VSVWPRELAQGEDFGESLSLGLEGPIEDLYRPPLDVIFGQLFGLFSSLAHGFTPDTPSPKGAISRVVTQVQIY